MTTAEDVLAKAFTDKKFLNDFLENPEGALKGFSLSPEERTRLDRALDQSHQIKGIDVLRFLKSITEPGLKPPPPPPWRSLPPLSQKS